MGTIIIKWATYNPHIMTNKRGMQLPSLYATGSDTILN